jgi:hypothetical protein
LDPAKMTENIRLAGYTPILTDVRLTVTAKVEKCGDTLVLVLGQMKTPVELTTAPHASTPETAPHLVRHVGAVVEAEGYWMAKAPKQLAVTAVRVLKQPGGQPSP